MSDFVLPGAAYTEKHAIYANLEGRAQRTQPAVAPPGDARQDWAIIRAISEVAGCPLSYDDLVGVRQRIQEIAPGLLEFDVVQPSDPICFQVASNDAKVAYTITIGKSICTKLLKGYKCGLQLDRIDLIDCS